MELMLVRPWAMRLGVGLGQLLEKQLGMLLGGLSEQYSPAGCLPQLCRTSGHSEARPKGPCYWLLVDLAIRLAASGISRFASAELHIGQSPAAGIG
jgi:hypothetical protein